MLVNLSSLSVLPQEPPENPHSAQPHDLGRHPRLTRTLSLSGTRVPSLPLGSLHVPNSSTRVDDGRLDNDVSIFEELADSGSGVGIGDLGGLLGVEPDLSLTDAGNVGSQTVEGWTRIARGQLRVLGNGVFEDDHETGWKRDEGERSSGRFRP